MPSTRAGLHRRDRGDGKRPDFSCRCLCRRYHADEGCAQEKKGRALGDVGDAGPRDFTALVEAIEQAHEYRAATASRAINISLTVGNWIIGACIHHYELHGSDRADYRDRLLTQLAERLGNEKMTRTQ
ncbi:MAG: hypothetical protein JWO49_3030 [Arthrobacter sp.]|jgi:hypothetical protein|nr:hypothetical protein [Arthrobacter sp.]